MTFYVCTLQLSAQVLLVVELHAFHQSFCITNKERNKEKREYSLNFTTHLQSHLCPIFFFLLALQPPLGVVFYSPLVGFSLLAYEVS